MSGTNYHMEALRKTRVLERKQHAERALGELIGKTGGETGIENGDNVQEKQRFGEIGHYQQTRHNYWRIGRERDRKQYDHSRNGPVNDRTRYALKQEFNFLGNSLSMLNDNMKPDHKPIPVCRRY